MGITLTALANIWYSVPMIISITDVETSGLDPRVHEILEIGVVKFDSETFKIMDTLNIKVKPEHPEAGDPIAYKINGYTAEEWKDGMKLWDAMAQYRAFVDDTTFCAHNMIFDYNFIDEASRKTDIKMPFNRHKIDLLTLAWCKLRKDTNSLSLKAICNHLGIEPEDDVHRAVAGAMTEYKVFKKLME